MLARSLAAFLTVFAVADAGYIHRGPELPEGYTEGSIVWTGFEHLLKNSGANHPADIKALEGASFNGTIENVMAQLESKGYSTEHLKKPLSEVELTAILGDENGSDETSPAIAEKWERVDFHNCGVGGRGLVARRTVNNGIGYLGHLGHDVKCKNQPGTCGQISCSYSTAIWWCNDQAVDMEYECRRFAIFARDVEENCVDESGLRCRGEAGSKKNQFRVQVGRSFTEC